MSPNIGAFDFIIPLRHEPRKTEYDSYYFQAGHGRVSLERKAKDLAVEGSAAKKVGVVVGRKLPPGNGKQSDYL